jgi:hypothetical protein
MRRKLLGDIVLSEGRRRANDQLHAVNCLCDISRYQREPRVVSPVDILDQDARTRRLMCGDLVRIAPPKAHLVFPKREIPRGRKRAVSPAQYRDPHATPPRTGVFASICFSMKC